MRAEGRLLPLLRSKGAFTALLPSHSAIARIFGSFPGLIKRRPDGIEDLLEIVSSALSDTARNDAAIIIRERFQSGEDDCKRLFFELLAKKYDADPEAVDAAINRYNRDRDTLSLAALHIASEPRRQEILRRLTSIPDGLAWLIELREQAVRLADDIPDFQSLDQDFVHLLSSWFLPSFLELRRVDFGAPAHLMTKLMRYEAVHAIDTWQSLRARLEPPDRRCYAFFHPQLKDDPIIFVEIGLTREIPASIDNLLSLERPIIEAETANTAVFYSISNCQRGLRGIPFGGLLLKEVINALSGELPSVKTFVTLSPIPGFAGWLRSRGLYLDPGGPAEDDDFHRNLLAEAAGYLAATNAGKGDPVARFHLGNGAVIDRLNVKADMSEKGIRQSFGIMVNYRYDLERLEHNRQSFKNGGAASVSPEIRRLAHAARQPGIAASSF